MAKRQILTLTSDFGTADGYVGAIKGRVVSVVPQVTIHDITHDIPPQDIWRGAWALKRAAPNFPEGTVHLAVVDPGVGSARVGVVVETDRYVFVGPDNGLLTLAAQDDTIRRVIEIREDAKDWNKSASFDGLSMFAPVAAMIMAGMSLDQVGEEAEDMVEFSLKPASKVGNLVEGEVVLFDRFGNAITNIPGDWLVGEPVERVVLKDTIMVRYSRFYSEVAGGDKMGAIINSDGFVELALFGESLQDSGLVHLGDPVRILIKPR